MRKKSKITDKYISIKIEKWWGIKMYIFYFSFLNNILAIVLQKTKMDITVKVESTLYWGYFSFKNINEITPKTIIT